MDTLRNAIIENKADNLIRIASDLHTQALQKNAFVFASEMLLLQSIGFARVGSYGESEKSYLTFLEKFKDRISLFHFIRSKIFRARILLKKGDVPAAKQTFDEIGGINLTGMDPLLRADFYLLKAEITTYEHYNTENCSPMLIISLEEYLKSLQLASLIPVERFGDNKILGRHEPLELLLSLLAEEGNTEKLLHWLDYARRKTIETWIHSADLPWEIKDKEHTARLNTVTKEFRDNLEAYLQLLQSLSSDLAKLYTAEEPAEEQHNEVFNDELLYRRGLILREKFARYLQTVEEICLEYPVNAILRGGIPLNTSRIQRVLDRETAVIIYTRTGSDWHAVLITDRNITPHRFNLPSMLLRDIMTPLEESMENFRFAFEPGANVFDKQELSSLRMMYQILFQPMEPSLAGVKRLYICSDDILLALPVSFFWDGLKFLGERYGIINLFEPREVYCYLKKTEAGITPGSSSPGETLQLINSIHSAASTTGQVKSREDVIYIIFQEKLLNRTPMATTVKIPGMERKTLMETLRECPNLQAACLRFPFAEPSETTSFCEDLITEKKILTLLPFLNISCAILSPEAAGIITSELLSTPVQETQKENHLSPPKRRSEDVDGDDLIRATFHGTKKGRVFGDILIPLSRKNNKNLPPFSEILFSNSKPILTPPEIHDSILFIGGEDTFLYAVDTVERIIKWKFKTSDWLFTPPIIDDNVLLISGMDRNIRALFLTDGRKKWEQKLSSVLAAEPILEGENICLLCRDGTIYVLDRKTGRQMMGKKLEPKTCTGMFLYNETLIVLTGDGKLLALANSNLNYLWDKEISDRKFTTSALEGEILYAGDENGKLFAINVCEKRKCWENNLNHPPIHINVEDPKVVVALTRNGHLSVNRKDNGSVLWEQSDINPSLLEPGFDQFHIWIQTKDKTLAALDRETGKIARSFDSYESDYKFIYLHDEEVYTISTDNLVTHFRIKTQHSPTEYLIASPEKPFPTEIPPVSFLSNNLLGTIDTRWDKERMAEKLAKKPGNPTVVSQHPQSGDPVKAASIKKESTPKKTPLKERKSPPETPAPDNNTDEVKDELQVADKSPAQLNADLVTPLTIIHDRIFAGTANEQIICFNMETLELLWKTNLDARLAFPPVAFTNHILAVDIRGQYYVLETATGEIKWVKQVCPSFSSPPYVTQGNLYIGGSDERIYCISVINGAIRWSVRLGQEITATPFFFDQYIYVGGSKGVIAKLDSKSGEVIFQTHTYDSISLDLVAHRDNIIAVGSRNCLYSLGQRNGYVNWKYYSSQTAFTGPPIVKRDELFLGTREGEILIIDGIIGKQVRKIPPREAIIAPLVELKRTFIFVTQTGKIYAWSPRTGEFTLTYQAKEPIRFTLVIDRTYLYFIEGQRSIKRLHLESLTPPDLPELNLVTDKEEEAEKIEYPSPAPKETKTDEPAVTRERVKQPENQVRTPIRKVPSGTAGTLLPPKTESTPKENEDLWAKILIYTIPLAGLFILFLTSSIDRGTLLFWGILLIALIAFIAITDYLKMENTRLRSLMNKLVPTSLQPKLDGGDQEVDEKEVSILFQDLYNYTSITECLSSDELVSLVKDIDKITNEVVSKYGGEIMSYIGDAQMIAFNVSKEDTHHAIKAVQAALEINKRVTKLGEKLAKEGRGRFPFTLLMGFGINTGQALIGVRGGDNRMEPFVMGDTTNTAVRLQKLTRKTDRRLLVSAPTAIRLSNLFKLEDLGVFELKGKKTPIKVYAVMEV